VLYRDGPGGSAAVDEWNDRDRHDGHADKPALAGFDSAIRSGLRVERATSLVSRVLNKAEISIVETRSDSIHHVLSDSLPVEDSYIFTLMLTDFASCESWLDGRHAEKVNIRAGDTTIADLRRDPRFVMTQPFQALFFNIPDTALDAIAEEAAAPRINGLTYQTAAGHDDEIIRNLGGAMRAAIHRPEQVNRLFVDHLVLALTAHVAQTYGGLRLIKDLPKGGLAPWQVRRACDALASRLEGDVPLKEIAAECGLSVSHFSRAFRQSTGLPPHRWLLRQRIQLAKVLMEDNRQTLAQIAVAAGFADQSHFTRVFAKHAGTSPGAWRRAREIGFNNDND
jgi:AraC family transcriptional regulator